MYGRLMVCLTSRARDCGTELCHFKVGNRRLFVAIKKNLSAVLIGCVIFLSSLQPQFQVHTHRNLLAPNAPQANTYNQENIMKTAKYFSHFPPRLLVFDGLKFEAFGIMHNETSYFDAKYTFRYAKIVPLLVKSLIENFPQRFQPGKPVFQLLFSDADSPQSNCFNDACPTTQFSPIVFFGSTPKNESVFPTMKLFPHTIFIECLHRYKVKGRKNCLWRPDVNHGLKWEDLKDTLIWRGSDFPFMEYVNEFHFDGPNCILSLLSSAWKDFTSGEVLLELSRTNWTKRFTPRWRAVLDSILAQTNSGSTWIDARFIDNVAQVNSHVHLELARKGIHVIGKQIDPFNMSSYKYQIDIGGGGGTSWEGTLTKLRMPGILFHHETLSKDWFYDLMVPWKHYIPVHIDLRDLHSKWVYAQSNPEQAKAISDEASKLAAYILSSNYMELVYQELFVEYLGQLVGSYSQTNDSWESAQSRYEENGYQLYSIGTCDFSSSWCRMRCRQGIIKDIPINLPDSAEHSAESASRQD